MTAHFGAVIFDNDGVLVDSEPLANSILASLLTEYGLVMTAEECMAEFLGSSLDRVRVRVTERMATAVPEDFEARYHDLLLAEFRAALRPVTGIDSVLRALSAAGVGLCVASSGTRERVRVALETTGLAGWFGDRVVTIEDVDRGKPAPDLFLRAAEIVGVTPRQCAVIEDSALGVEAAMAAGMTAFGYAGRTPAGQLGDARGGVVSDMESLGLLLGVSVPPPG